MIKIDSLKLILNDSKEDRDVGYFSFYYVSGKVGIKIIFRDQNDKTYRSIKSESNLKKSNVWKEAKKEFKILTMLKDSGFTPKPIKLVASYNTTKKCWLPAIVMEHVRGVNLYHSISKMFRFDKKKISTKKLSPSQAYLLIHSSVSNALEKHGVINNDIHYGNLIDNNGKLMVIDFGMAKRLLKRKS